jgi:hypothetical protein
MITRGVSDYLKNEVVSQTRVFKEIPAEFPRITICNINPLTSIFANTLWSAEFDKWIKLTNNIIKDRGSYNYSFTEYFQYNMKKPEVESITKYKLGQNLFEMIADCNFANQKCLFNYSAAYNLTMFNEFEKSYSLNFGTCFRFNSLFDLNDNQIPIKKVIKDGVNSELELLLNLKDQTDIPNLYDDRGFILFIENQSHVPSTFNNGIFLKTGTSTKISMKKLITERLPPLFSDCRSEYPDDSIYDIYKQKRFIYKSRDCFNLCIQKLIVENCGCYSLLYDIHDESIPVCDFYSECLRNYCNPITLQSLFKPLERSCFNTYANQYCVSLCPTECYSVSYDLTLSYSDFPNQEFADKLAAKTNILQYFYEDKSIKNKYITVDLMKYKFAKVKIFFSDLSYTFVTEKEKMEWIDFLANIGEFNFLTSLINFNFIN